jgi:hypothetical protein
MNDNRDTIRYVCEHASPLLGLKYKLFTLQELFDVVLTICDLKTKFVATRACNVYCEQQDKKTLLTSNDYEEQYVNNLQAIVDTNDKQHLQFLYRCHLDFYDDKDDNTKNKMLLKYDFLDNLSYNCNLSLLLYNRILTLRCNCPSYLTAIANEYVPVLKRLYDEHLLFRCDSDQLTLLFDCIPNTFSPLDDCSHILHILKNLSPEIAAYYLGFSIDTMQPSFEILERAFERLKTIGVEAYLETIKQRVTKSLIPSCDMYNETFIIGNEENVLGIPIDEHLPFDIVSYHDGARIFFFTRSELPTTIKSGKNCWTGEQLPEAVLQSFSNRLVIASKLSLPKCESAEELYERMEDFKIVCSCNLCVVKDVKVRDNRSNRSIEQDIISTIVEPSRTVLSRGHHEIQALEEYEDFGYDEEYESSRSPSRSPISSLTPSRSNRE